VCIDEETIAYRRLVSSIPLSKLIELIEDVPEAVREAAGRLRATHLYYLDVALRGPVGQPYHWIYVPEDRYPFYRVGCYSHFSKEMAPPGKACLYVELVDRQPPSVDVLLPAVAAALCEMGVVANQEAIVFARLRRIDHAYVIFDDCHASSVETVHAYLREVGIVSTGRYGAWNYSSMGDALAFGQRAADDCVEATS
jgi:protoporphyrinogen oxidase